MGAGGVVIGIVLGCDSKDAALFDDVKELLRTADQLLVQTNHVDVALLVLPYLQQIPVIEQVEQLAAVDFEESHNDLHRSMLRLNRLRSTCSRNRNIYLAPR